MQERLQVPLRRFPAGKDGGIDLVDSLSACGVLVQVKHYLDVYKRQPSCCKTIVCWTLPKPVRALPWTRLLSPAKISFTRNSVSRKSSFCLFFFQEKEENPSYLVRVVEIVGRHIHRPVSYTHLDVYKRQPTLWWLLMTAASPAPDSMTSG